ncbi:hypothetical protein [Pararcticibacter amylolyticus]|nr:hypothetical protein [Pararcticibacter amylolyticus]
MKTLATLTAAVLFVTVFTASADERREMKSETTAVSIKAPAFEFGSPSDLSDMEIEKLKRSMFKAPAFVWGDPEEVNAPARTTAEVKAINAPAFEWGTTDDINNRDIEFLKFQAPAFNWGSPNDLDLKEIEKLRK